MLYLGLLIYFVMSAGVGYLGRQRSFGFVGFFILSLIFSPLIIALVLLITRQKASRKLVGPKT